MQFDQFLARALQGFGVLFAGGVDQFVKAFHFGDGIARQGGGIEPGFPADDQFPKLRAPIAQMIVRHHPVSQQPGNPRQRIAQNRRANVPDVHRLGRVGRTKINDDGAGPLRFLHQRQVAARQAAQRLGDGRDFEPEIQKARPGDFHRLAPLAHVQTGGHIRGQLARIELARLGQSHERIGLIIAETRLRAGAHQHPAGVGVRQDGGHRLLQSLFEQFVKHNKAGSSTFFAGSTARKV